VLRVAAAISGRHFGGRRILLEGSTSTRSSASAHEKRECKTEITFARVDALRSLQLSDRNARKSETLPDAPMPRVPDLPEPITTVWAACDAGAIYVTPPDDWTLFRVPDGFWERYADLVAC
jgi:hypothetical protein